MNCGRESMGALVKGLTVYVHICLEYSPGLSGLYRSMEQLYTKK